MVENAFPATAPENPAEMEVAINQMFAEMERIDERIRKKRIRIDKLKVETRAILKTLKAD